MSRTINTTLFQLWNTFLKVQEKTKRQVMVKNLHTHCQGCQILLEVLMGTLSLKVQSKPSPQCYWREDSRPTRESSEPQPCLWRGGVRAAQPCPTLCDPLRFHPFELAMWERKTQIPTQSSSGATSGPRRLPKASLDLSGCSPCGRGSPTLASYRRETPMAEGGQQRVRNIVCTSAASERAAVHKVEVQEERKWNPPPSNTKALGYSLNKKHDSQTKPWKFTECQSLGQRAGVGRGESSLWNRVPVGGMCCHLVSNIRTTGC